MNGQYEKLGELLCALRSRLVTAESCTAGMVAAALGDIEGCGAWLEGAFVTYTEQAKQAMLGVTAQRIARHGLTSEEVARDMAAGALRGSQARLAIANTGVAGPDDAPDGTRAGTVCFAWTYRQGERTATHSETRRFEGDRNSVRRQAADYAIARAIALLQSWTRQ